MQLTVKGVVFITESRASIIELNQEVSYFTFKGACYDEVVWLCLA